MSGGALAGLFHAGMFLFSVPVFVFATSSLPDTSAFSAQGFGLLVPSRVFTITLLRPQTRQRAQAPL
eukprot:15360756-Alexandrium_andersonii.AAC.1